MQLEIALQPLALIGRKHHQDAAKTFPSTKSTDVRPLDSALGARAAAIMVKPITAIVSISSEDVTDGSLASFKAVRRSWRLYATDTPRRDAR